MAKVTALPCRATWWDSLAAANHGGRDTDHVCGRAVNEPHSRHGPCMIKGCGSYQR
jgi:hypothetical protein